MITHPLDPMFRNALEDLPAIPKPAMIEGDEAHQAALAIEAYKHAREQEKLACAPWKDLQDEARQVLAWAMERLESDSIESDAGRAYMQAGYSRATYDARALDAMCVVDPDLALKLTPFRSERQYKPRLQIR